MRHTQFGVQYTPFDLQCIYTGSRLRWKLFAVNCLLQLILVVFKLCERVPYNSLLGRVHWIKLLEGLWQSTK